MQAAKQSSILFVSDWVFRDGSFYGTYELWVFTMVNGKKWYMRFLFMLGLKETKGGRVAKVRSIYGA